VPAYARHATAADAQQTRTSAQVVALLTSVIFDHSLKVRVLHVPDDAPPAPVTPLDVAKADTVAVAATSGDAPTASPGGEGSDTATLASSAAASTAHSRGATSTSGTTAVGDASADKKAGKKDDEKPKKKQDLVGRLNTLVTSGLPRSFLTYVRLRSFPHRYG
jgi:hypothetical protein